MSSLPRVTFLTFFVILSEKNTYIYIIYLFSVGLTIDSIYDEILPPLPAKNIPAATPEDQKPKTKDPKTKTLENNKKKHKDKKKNKDPKESKTKVPPAIPDRPPKPLPPEAFISNDEPCDIAKTSGKLGRSTDELFNPEKDGMLTGGERYESVCPPSEDSVYSEPYQDFSPS